MQASPSGVTLYTFGRARSAPSPGSGYLWQAHAEAPLRKMAQSYMVWRKWSSALPRLLSRQLNDELMLLLMQTQINVN